ncbi:hypothetical protein LV457_10070 [Mycobacterium sp. MYCO198283]|uniref:hypothetical protein n=1 Tax=Mycobacterium sp. MYCO198283 TaxID=2883505 RepID=UPI001E5078AE|nr:hypothetical protein [Mycobacterium sp. MYCO198283]MCG5432632.1 hypothetical protein [Mycobacterium sp. MYCO198283]
MTYTHTGPRQRRQTAVAVFLAFWVIVVGAEWALPGLDPAPQHGAHGLATSPVGALAPVTIEHPHLSSGSAPESPELFAEAVLPRGTVALLALGLIAAAVTVLTLWRHLAPAAVRGPPRRKASASTGRQTLTRLCIARR